MMAKSSIRLSLLLAGLLVASGGFILQAQDNAPEPALPELSQYSEEDQPAPAEEAATPAEVSTESTTGTGEEVSVGELKELMNLPPTARIKESQEDLENPPSLFNKEDQATIKRIFGEKPPFVYFPVGVDPMVIPWVRARIVAEELFEESAIAAANKDFDKAENTLREIREKYPETEVAAGVPAELDRIRKLREVEREKSEGPKTTVVDNRPKGPEVDNDAPTLPDWVRTNTTAVLVGDDARVVIENDFLAVGDAVPRYPTVRVKSITNSEVVFEFQKKDFTVEVDGSF